MSGHSLADAKKIARWRRSLFLALALCASTFARAAEKSAPIWLVGNGFHTSIALRVQDAPFARELLGDRSAKVVMFGWGAQEFYRGRTNPWTLLQAIVGTRSLLHVVPVRGAIAERFSHSDIVRLELSRAAIRALAADLEQALARDANGRFQFVGRGYDADSRFFTGRERFYFPKMCNTWIAAKLRRAGVPVCVPLSLTAPSLVAQASRSGEREQRRSRPADAF